VGKEETMSIPKWSTKRCFYSSGKFQKHQARVEMFGSLNSATTFSITTFSITTLSIMTLNIDTQHYDTQHNDTQHNDTQHNDTQHKGLICDTQHK
jgi:hypothetical protein